MTVDPLVSIGFDFRPQRYVGQSIRIRGAVTKIHQVLSDVMEGILGALYVSDNCTLEGAEKFFSKIFKPFFDEFVTFEMLVRHAADAVLEMLNRLGCRQYSNVHNVENGMHSCKSEPSLRVPPHCAEGQ